MKPGYFLILSTFFPLLLAQSECVDSDVDDDGWTTDDGDCDDNNEDVHPGAPEVCDGVDNDCNGDIDDEDQDVVGQSLWYYDADNDNYGVASQTVLLCYQPEEYAPNSGDCNDSNPSINPGASEVCDAIDNDCDGDVDANDDDLQATLYYQDSDGDGFGDPATETAACLQPTGYITTSGDCNDNNANVNPAATEICDTIDNDCDQLVDDSDPDTVGGTTWYRDIDGDGYGTSSNTTQSCTRPDGYAAQSGDCNDGNANVYPGAEEICDTLDNNCDSYVDDADTDGYSASECGGLDCDDSDAATNPDADEVCSDGIDNNCDGSGCTYPSLSSLNQAAAKIIGETDSAYTATVSASAGDINKDGYADIIVGIPGDNAGGSEAGAAYVVLGPVTGTVDLSTAFVKFVGENAYDHAGVSVASAGDINKDGYGDIIVGAFEFDVQSSGTTVYTNAGAAYLFYGPTAGGTIDLSMANVKFTGIAAGDRAGRSVASGGDINRDGTPDLLIAANLANDGGTDAGTIYVMHGQSWGATVRLTAANAKIIGENNFDYAGSALISAGDVNRDGYSDIFIGAYGYDVGGDYGGAAYLVHGPVSGTLDLVNATAKRTGEATQNYAGFSIAAGQDINNDGNLDFLVGAPNAFGTDSESGLTYVLYGPISGNASLANANATLIGEAGDDESGYSVAISNDLNADGYADLIVGARYESSVQVLAGAVYVVYGPLDGDFDLGLSDAKMVGESDYDYAGRDVAAAGDVNRDGVPDFLVSASGDDDGGNNAGAVYLVGGYGL